MTDPLVSSHWLHDNLNHPDLIILDASSNANKSGLIPEFQHQKIKGARHFDLKNTFSDPNGLFPNTFPSKVQFEKGCESLGINNASRIVVYDNLGIYTSPRVWWMFKAMGHESVYVLNGGLPDWIRQGYETTEFYETPIESGNYKSKLQPELIKSISFIESNISEKSHLLIDARSEGRFNGTIQEPRKGLQSGHIPHSINIPFEHVLENGYYKSTDALKTIFEKKGISNQDLVFSCGSGVTACIVLLAISMTMDNSTAVYDGSWTEWASLKLNQNTH